MFEGPKFTMTEDMGLRVKHRHCSSGFNPTVINYLTAQQGHATCVTLKMATKQPEAAILDVATEICCSVSLQ